MVDSVNNISYVNYNTCTPIKSRKQSIGAQVHSGTNSLHSIPFTSQRLRTECSSKQEKEQYTTILNLVDKNTRKHLEILLKSGVLLNNNSNDKSTVLENLYKIATTPRANGLNSLGILTDTITTISYPYIITQQFGDIPTNYRQTALNANADHKQDSIDIDHSGTCVAASIEFSLAEKMPAEFARFAQCLSSPDLSVNKNIKLSNLSDNTLDSVWLLNAFNIPYEANNFNSVNLKFAPDKNAIIRAQIQTTDKDPGERSPLDVLMQSTFMQIGSQQTYNTLTDKRSGTFNQNDKGLIEFEKTFTESVVMDKNRTSVTYQTVDENARLIGYETDFKTMKKHITKTLDRHENVIIGYTLVDKNNFIVNGHEITIVDYKKDRTGKVTFICNDTDDDLAKPIEYSEDYLLPKIHHAALPQDIAENDLNITPNWVESLNNYQKLKEGKRNDITC